jgi:hypothetical protein
VNENSTDQVARPWTKGGPSPNPGGRPAHLAEVRDLARRFTAEAVVQLVKLMRGAENEAVRCRAAEALLDRAWGKPVQGVVAQVAVEQHVDAEQLRASLVERLTRLTRLTRLVAAEPVLQALPAAEAPVATCPETKP